MTKPRNLVDYVSAFFRDEIRLARGFSEHTYRSYKISIKSLIGFLERKLQKQLFSLVGDDLSFEYIHSWMLEQASENDWSPSTWNSRLSAIKTFIRYMGRQDIRSLDLVSRVELIRNKRKSKNPAEYMTLSEFNSVIATIDARSKTNFRDLLIFQFLFFSGARVSELTGIEVNDIKFLRDNSISLNLQGKGRKTRNVIIKEKATIKNLKEYCGQNFRNPRFGGFLFPGQNGKQMSRKNISRIIKKHFSDCIDRRISPHSFRHSAAMNWLESGIEIYTVSVLLGHNDLKTTTDYLRSTFKMRSDALDRSGQNQQLSHIFEPEFASNAEFWNHLGIEMGNAV